MMSPSTRPAREHSVGVDFFILHGSFSTFGGHGSV